MLLRFMTGEHAVIPTIGSPANGYIFENELYGYASAASSYQPRQSGLYDLMFQSGNYFSVNGNLLSGQK